MNVILVGMKHCGKTSIGRALSRILNKRFIDIDEIIKELFFDIYKKRKNIFEIFKILKEKKFKALENKAFFSIKNVKNSVIATAGGSVLNDKNLKILKNSKIIIYLKTTLDELKKRILQSKENSIFQDEKFLLKTFEFRKSIYENLSDITMHTDDKDIKKIAMDIKMYLKNLEKNI